MDYYILRKRFSYVDLIVIGGIAQIIMEIL